jgi:predicted nucleic acid-binding protein
VVTFVLDTSAVLRYIDNEAGADRVSAVFLAQASGTSRVIISAVNWGELTSTLLKRYGPQAAQAARKGLGDLRIEVISANAGRAVRSAEIKFKYGIPYADAFGVELAGDSPDHCLITADFDVKPAAEDFQIEFLPPKPKP